MSQTFTPTAKFSTNERDWQAEIGMLPWTTSIVFTKETLVRFLKQLDVEVDPNMSQLKKLPKFATFGNLSAASSDAPPPSSEQQAPSTSDAPSQQSDTPAFIPTRKVREQPGGGSSQIAALLGGNREQEAADWVPPPIPQHGSPSAAAYSPAQQSHQATEESDGPAVLMPDGSRFIPSRKVREPVGGHSNMAALLSGGH